MTVPHRCAKTRAVTTFNWKEHMGSEIATVIAQRILEQVSRRRALHTGLSAIAVWAGSADAAAALAAKKKKKRRRKPSSPLSPPAAPPPPLPPCGGRCSAQEPRCCPSTAQDPGGLCVELEDQCCSSANGGGSCPKERPQCCPPDRGFACCGRDETCCADVSDCSEGLSCVSGCCKENVTGAITAVSPASGSHENRRR